MLHLFNSCYVYPVHLFDPTNNYLMVGKDQLIKPSIVNSFFYNNSSPKDAFERYESFEKFSEGNLVEPCINAKTTFIIYADNDEFIKFFTSKLKTQVSRLTQEFFLDAAKLFAVRLNIRAKLIPDESIRNNIKTLADMFMTLDKIPDTKKLNISENWIRYNAGIEWKLANEDYSTVDDIVNRYVYSFFPEASAKYLSRKDPEGSWVVNKNNQRFQDVVSMKDLYMEMRKEFNTFTDPTILRYYELGARELVKDPLFLLLLSANKNMGDKVDIWLLRWMLNLPKEQINQLGIIT
jgi:hypothetical protein